MFQGALYTSLSQLYRSAQPKPAVSLKTFSQRIGAKRRKKTNSILDEAIIWDCLYLAKDEFNSKYQTRRTYVSTVDGLIIVRDKYDELSLTHDNLVSYQLFRQRLVRLVEREIKISQETILLAIQSTEAEWRLHFGRSGKFIYDGKRFYTIISLLDYLGRPDDYSMVRSRMSKGWSLEDALTPKREQGGGYIYKITQISTGRIYIGLTTTTVFERWKTHINDVEKKSPYPLHVAIRKAGSNDFKIETLLEHHSDEELKQAEKEAINRFKSLSPYGFNANIGGAIGGGLGVACDYKGEKFSSLQERNETLAKRYGLEPHVVDAWIKKGKSLKGKQRRVSENRLSDPDLQRQYLSLKREKEIVPRWENPALYFEDVRPDKYRALGFHLIRPDPKRPYGPDNFKWTTVQDKMEINHGRKITCFGKEYATVQALADDYNLKRTTVNYRLNKGKTAEEAVSEPAGNTRGIPFEYNGIEYPSLNAAAKHLTNKTGRTFGSVKYRLKTGSPL